LSITTCSPGLNSVVFRPHNVYGEFQNIGDPYRNVLGIFDEPDHVRGRMTIFGDGTQRRAFSYAGDIASVIAASAWLPLVAAVQRDRDPARAAAGVAIVALAIRG